MAIPVQWRRGTTAQMAAFTGAVGEITVNTTTKRLHLHDGVTPGGIVLARLDDVPVVASGLRNRLINGNFAINQRVVSGAVVLAAGKYGHDRWKAGAAGCSYTFVTSGQDTTITITAGSLMQVVEGVNVEGGIYTLSHAGTAQARTAINNAATSGAYAASPLQTVAATGGQKVTVEFATGTVSRVMLEPGAAASPFERRSFPSELTLCQRYFETSYPLGVAPGTPQVSNMGAHTTSTQDGTVGAVNLTFIFKVTKAGSPTMSCYNPVSGAASQIRDGGSVASGVTFANLNNAVSAVTCFNSGSAMTPNSLASGHFTAEAEL